MTTELFETGKQSGAEFSVDRRYRYRLWRQWSDRPLMAFIGLNPSTADETQDDPTIRRCIAFAKRHSYGGIMMLNIFACRATFPADMMESTAPIGPENDGTLKTWCKRAGIVVACWGVHGSHLDRAREVLNMLGREGIALHCFGLTKEGHPKHPLYLPGDAKLEVLFSSMM